MMPPIEETPDRINDVVDEVLSWSDSVSVMLVEGDGDIVVSITAMLPITDERGIVFNKINRYSFKVPWGATSERIKELVSAQVYGLL